MSNCIHDFYWHENDQCFYCSSCEYSPTGDEMARDMNDYLRRHDLNNWHKLIDHKNELQAKVEKLQGIIQTALNELYKPEQLRQSVISILDQTPAQKCPELDELKAWLDAYFGEPIKYKLDWKQSFEEWKAQQKGVSDGNQ